jgi:hypothetical protein
MSDVKRQGKNAPQMKLFSVFCLLSSVICLLSSGPAAARDAAFMDPGMAAGGNTSTEAVTVEPKSDIDTGESEINIARRVTLFFVNQTNMPIDVVSMTTNNDGNVKSDIVSDDCTKGGKITPASRCSVVIEVTPISPGPWTAEVLLTHSGTGRIAKAKLSGKTTGQSAAEKKDAGLALSTKDVKPVDFGEVEANASKAVRSALMVNDSSETITLLSIDVIAAENGLERLEQGCAVDMELKPGESCPVTLVWKPTAKGQISTDLIIRHSGKLGFAVIPVRGNARAEAVALNRDLGKDGKSDVKGMSSTADALQKAAADKIPPLSSDLLPTTATGTKDSSHKDSSRSSDSGTFHLIGTVGNRAVLLKPDETTAIVDIGEDIPYGEDKIAKIVSVTQKTADIFIDGKKKTLRLEAVESLTSKAAESQKEAAEAKAKGSMGGAKTGSSSGSSYSSSSVPFMGGK